jgi:hypothetical protein
MLKKLKEEEIKLVNGGSLSYAVISFCCVSAALLYPIANKLLFHFFNSGHQEEGVNSKTITNFSLACIYGRICLLPLKDELPFQTTYQQLSFYQMF